MNNILITGTSKGIGFELSKIFLDQGHFVFGCSRSNQTIFHKNYEHYICDVSSEKDVVNLKNNIIKNNKKIDILINNAGIASMNHIITTPINSAEKIINTNFIGTFLFTREISKIMISNKVFGRIVNFSTCATPLNLEGEAIYASSKSAVETFSRISAKELSKYNITVNILGITPYQTDLILGVPKEKIDKLLENQIIKRYPTINDIKNAVDFFISENSSFITGQTLYLGGIL